MFPLLMAPSGGFPSQPTFLSAVVTGNIQFGSASTAGTISGGNFNGANGTFSGTDQALNFSGTNLTLSGNGQAIFGSSVASAFAWQFQENAGSGTNFGMILKAGTTSADTTLEVNNSTSTATYFSINGDGNGSLGPGNGKSLTWTTNGNYTFALPAFGATVSATANAGDSVFVATTKNAGIAYDSTAAASTQTSGLGFGQVGQTHWQIYQPTASSDFRLFGGADRFTIDSAGNVTIPIDLTVGSPTGGPQGTGSVNAVKLFQQGAQVPKFSYGVIVESGATCSIAAAGTAANLNLASCGSAATGTATATFTAAYTGPPTCTSTADSFSNLTVSNTAGAAVVTVTNSIAGVATNANIYVICVGT